MTDCGRVEIIFFAFLRDWMDLISQLCYDEIFPTLPDQQPLIIYIVSKMKVVEYRIVLPLTVEEYRTGQLYMIQRLSQEESGHGEGVEIVVNQPYDHRLFRDTDAISAELQRQQQSSFPKSPVETAPASPKGWFSGWKAKRSSSTNEGLTTSSSVPVLLSHGVSPCLSLGGAPGTAGQYTYKLFRIGRRLPNFVKAVLPSSALVVEEHAWNYFPSTRTVYRSPLLGDRFFMDIATTYLDDAGTTENALNLNEDVMGVRDVQFIDIASASKVSSKNHKNNNRNSKDNENDSNDDDSDEDTTPAKTSSNISKDVLTCDCKIADNSCDNPRHFQSKVTGRGPLPLDWYIGTPKSWPLMCSYKVCRVEFRWWGLQTQVEKFIHSHGLYAILLKGHRKVFCWIDEWYGKTVTDMRSLEAQAQHILAEKAKANSEFDDVATTSGTNDDEDLFK